ncbi:hypothetical protein FB45DRAFT_997174 [Roridomyces roridus]|uniref:BTB domain-containing protein n=1 Tax=Roridomyces roridus TaxID=1738132 RepID=A0AAD7CJ23_9AGAR|nr:hypothetical protein FB45DRAFT_997174 [Roridomyces roridus]
MCTPLDPGPSARRQRSDSGEIVVRSSEIWHSDGSVVLQAGCTQFRVHWSVLSLHSSFFRDLQGLPQPPDEPQVEGCPLIQLSDSSEDLETVLKSLYDPLFFLQPSLPLSVIASHIRLGRKYDLKNILAAVVERLTYENPSTLEEYDRLIGPSGGYFPTKFEFYRGAFLDVLTLARENNLFGVLPCAYWRATFYTQAELFDGVQRPDGTLATLSPADIRLCILARIQMQKNQWDEGHSCGWLWTGGSERCKHNDSCGKSRTRLSQELVLKGEVRVFPQIDWMLERSKVCDACKEDGRIKLAEGRRKMWELLPSFFELPPWAELKMNCRCSCTRRCNAHIQKQIHTHTVTLIQSVREKSTAVRQSSSARPSSTPPT